jgi:hypothetical protein
VQHAPENSKKEIDKVYGYHGPDGVLRFEVVRFKNPKDFAQRAVIGTKRVWKMKGVDLCLYRLPQLLAAQPHMPVFIVEGEKDADNLAAKGQVATCNPMGAEKWKDAYSESLRGRNVVIVPDNDEAGRRHADNVACSLQGKAASVKVVELPGLPDHGDVSDFLASGATIEEMRVLADNAPDWSPSPQSAAVNPPGSKPEPETHAAILLRLAGSATLFHSAEGRAYGAFWVNDHHEVHEIRSTGFRRWLIRAFYGEQARPPSSEAMQSALGVIEARATIDGPLEAVFVRVGSLGDTTYLDLGNPSWQCVEIKGTGWRVIGNPPVRFRRSSGLRDLPCPKPGGSLDSLKRFLNLIEDDFILLIAWVTAALRSTGPYPILVLLGEQGATKSTASRVARRLVDPHVSLLRSEPREPRDLMIAACNSWVMTIDNLSNMSPWLSDGLCRLATGGGFATRALYTDSEETFLDAMRPVILNGIEDFATRGDLVDRCLFLHLPAIADAKRKTEAAFWEDFEKEYPRILGSLLDAVSGGLRHLADVQLTALPRMADFAQWGDAVGRELKWPAGKFLDIYSGNRKSANEMIVEDSPVARALREFAEKKLDWSDSPSKLLEELTAQVGQKVADSKRWPKTPRAMSGALRRLAPTLRMIGIALEFGKDHAGRSVTLKFEPPRKAGIGPSPASRPSPTLISQHQSVTVGKSPASPRVTDRHAESLNLQPRDDRDASDGRIPSLSDLNGKGKTHWVDPDFDYTRDP